MAYAVRYTNRAARQLRKLPAAAQKAILDRADKLAVNPRPPGAEKLSTEDLANIYRIRVGDYRIVYQINDKQLLILIVKVGDRREIYKRKFKL